jgi:ectoine hydroxylase-related dioxygenase (phytanoyl-CoA dioxygenase family)
MLDHPRDLRHEYHENGFVIARGVLDQQRIDWLLGFSEVVIRQFRKHGCPMRIKTSSDNEPATMQHPNHPTYFTDDRRDLVKLLELVADPDVLSLPQAVLCDDLVMRNIAFFFHPLQQSLEGIWHRDVGICLTDPQAEREDLLARRNPHHRATQMMIALIASDHFEVVPGSHRRWDTPEEFAVRRAVNPDGNRLGMMPGAVHVALQPGDAVVFDHSLIHRGCYRIDKPRRTLRIAWTMPGACMNDHFSYQPWFLEPGYLDGLGPQARAFYERFITHHRAYWQASAKAAS